jgi:hypothetical protein
MSRRLNLRFLPAIGILILMVFSTIQIIPMNVDSIFLDEFTNGEKSVTLEFERADIDAETVAIEVPLNGSIISASVDIEPVAYNGDYPTDIKVNVGNDDDNEWMFSGKGYGSFGEQTLFTDGKDKKYLFFNNNNYINSPKIMIPRNASVISTSMQIEGGTGNYDEDYFLAVDQYGYKMTYIKSNGDGTFGTPSVISQNLGRYLYGSVGIGDFDNDGDLDAVHGTGQSGNINYLEKTGPDNSFKAPVNVGSLSSSWYTYDFAVGDFTNDGNYDFITSGSNLVLFEGNGDGTFQEPVQINGGPSICYGKDAADFNHDGNLDFVTGGNTRYTVYYFQGNGDGTFQQPIQLNSPSTYYIYSVITDDFDGDKNADILAGYYDGMLYFFKGYGNGSFKSPTQSGVDAGRYSGGDGWDYDRDGDVDLIVIDSQYENLPTWPGSSAKFYKNNGLGSFTLQNTIANVGSYSYGGAAPPPKVMGANNTKMYIGDVSGSPADWSFVGRLAGVQEQVNDFSPKLNTLLKQTNYKSYTDEYNTEFLIIPINFTSTDNGLLRVSKFHIEYTYTATIEKKEFSTLAEELNEHIMFTGGETVDLRFIISSSSPGSLKFSNLNIVYNIPPDRKDEIQTLHAYEDTEDLNLLQISDYFIDSDEPATNLNYSVFKNTQADHVDVYTNFTNILKFTPLTENWYGETEVIVQAVDSGKKKAFSNPFKIIIHPVNDEPTSEVPLPDITIIEGEQDKGLDLELREYFSDIEDDLLYYTFEIDPRGFIPDADDKRIKVIKNDDNILEISGIGDFNSYEGELNKPIPVWIYCDDDPDVNTYSDGNFTYQEILITVLPINDKPIWSAIPDLYLNEDELSTFEDFINIYDFVRDDETDDRDLAYDLTTTNSIFEIIREGGLLSLNIPENYFGSGIITVSATDEKGSMSSTTFELFILPVNDPPTISLTSHIDYETVEDTITLGGKMDDIEGTVRLVEVKIESSETDIENAEIFNWQPAKFDVSINNWTYTWDTTMVPDGFYEITAQVYDGALTSDTSVEIQIKNGQNFEPIVEISYPAENDKVNGTIIISGTVHDPDLDGINDLQIRIGAEMDWTPIKLQSENQTVWSYTWDTTTLTDRNYNILAKAYDGRAWSIPASRVVEVFNNKTFIPPGSESGATEDNSIWTFAGILIIIVIILGVLVVVGLITRANKRVREYVPDGRMEPLDDLEAMVKPALGPGVSIEHQPLPAGPPTQAPGLPPVQAASPYAATAPPTLPAAGAVQSPTGAQQQVPALPAAQTVNVTPTQQNEPEQK